MSSPVRTVIGHGRILAHPNLPVETLSSSVAIGTEVDAGSFNERATFFHG